MDSKRTSYEKMLCITECSKNIYKALNISATIALTIAAVQSSNSNCSTPSTPTSAPTSPAMVTTGDEATSAAAASTTTPTVTSVTPRRTSGSRTASSTTSKNVGGGAASAASADDYLPAFIYIVLKANPTMLYSNINFVTRFAFEKRILQGEHAYHFCSLNASIAHIENLNAHHLNMSPDEFDNYCQGLMDMGDEASSSNVLKLIEINLKVLNELKDKQKLLKQETLKLQTDITVFRQLMQNKFTACLNNNKENYTHNVPGYVRPTTAASTTTTQMTTAAVSASNVLDDAKDIAKFNASAATSTSLLMPLKPTTTGTAVAAAAATTDKTVVDSTQQ